MKRLYGLGVGLIGLLLVAGGPSPAWAGACAVSVTGDTRGDVMVVIQGGNNVLQYSFADLDGTGSTTCINDCFDTNGDSIAAETAANGHSSVNPFSSVGTGELSDNLDFSTATAAGNRFPGLASSGSTTFQPLPGSPTFPSTGNFSCIAVSGERSGSNNTEIWILGLDGQGDATQCVFDLDGNATFIEGRSGVGFGGDLDDDGWRGLSTATPCGAIN